MTDAEPQRLIIAGSRTIRTARQSYSELKAGLQQGTGLVLDCNGLDEADLSLVQLIIAARHSAAASGQSVRLLSPPAGPLREVLTRGGFSPDSGTTFATDPAHWTMTGTGA